MINKHFSTFPAKPMVLGHLSRPCFFGKPKFWGSFLNILYFLEPKTLGNPQAMHQTPIGSVKNPPIFLVKGSHFCSPWKKKKRRTFSLTHSTHPQQKCHKKVTFTYFSLAKKIEPTKKNAFCKPSSSPGHCKCRWKTHSASSPRFKRTDGNHIV